MFDPPPPPTSPYYFDHSPPPLVSPSTDHFLSHIAHVSSSTNPPPRPLPPHVSQDFDVFDTMFTLGTAAHIHDIDRETFASALLSTFIYEIEFFLIENLPMITETLMHLALVVDLASSGID
jgi:hypothetical protein